MAYEGQKVLVQIAPPEPLGMHGRLRFPKGSPSTARTPALSL